MPDVKIWYGDDGVRVPEFPTLLIEEISRIVAENMSCHVPSEGGEDEFYQLHNGEIDLTVLQPFVNSEDTYIIVEVAEKSRKDSAHVIPENRLL